MWLKKGLCAGGPSSHLTISYFCAMQSLHHNTVRAFRKKVYQFFTEHGRSNLPWRQTEDPYCIMVSEIMLQQTQVDRVVDKYLSFLKKFPTLKKLAAASKADLLSEWQGLGYNRRAQFLQRAAQMVVSELGGVMPKDELGLVALPGVGPATASAICAYAYNLPVSYIETNIRAVFIHHFFINRESVDDKELLPIIEQCLDRENPRQWYSAIMDYGTDLKKRFKNPAKKSRHHVVQSKFKGSDREIRGAILRVLLQKGPLTEVDLVSELPCNDERFESIVVGMISEGFVTLSSKKYAIAES
ncbi:MAG: hypothetical protein OCD01_11120 [Fibrobacterales bacterium]